MQVKNLIIERKPSYSEEYPNQLVGLVQIQGEHGKMEVKLSSKVVACIFDIIEEDVLRVAKYNASQSGEAVQEASGELKLIESFKDD